MQTKYTIIYILYLNRINNYTHNCQTLRVSPSRENGYTSLVMHSNSLHCKCMCMRCIDSLQVQCSFQDIYISRTYESTYSLHSLSSGHMTYSLRIDSFVTELQLQIMSLHRRNAILNLISRS